ncbi:MAG: carbohydrate ABC transporter permease [Chloroflexota bacterium]|nr:carbohydrate ABC transporter permease [Chloroflexota bacterium]
MEAESVTLARPRHAATFTPREAAERLLTHVLLIAYTAVALVPIVLIIANSFKTRRAIFSAPFALPTSETFSLIGYQTVFARSNFEVYYQNSLIVTVASLALVLFFGAMAAHALAEYRLPGGNLMFLYLVLGIMIPIRLGTVSLLRFITDLGLTNTLLALILVYTAMGLPVAIFILRQMMEHVPRELKDAARIDGASEYRIFWLVLPLIRPAIGTVAVFSMLPIFNDLWFPLILAPSESTKTVTLGAQAFLGQFVTDWNAVLAALTLAMIPVFALYLLFSRQLLGGLTAGSVK